MGNTVHSLDGADESLMQMPMHIKTLSSFKTPCDVH